jgi:hypothetical protein
MMAFLSVPHATDERLAWMTQAGARRGSSLSKIWSGATGYNDPPLTVATRLLGPPKTAKAFWADIR